MAAMAEQMNRLEAQRQNDREQMDRIEQLLGGLRREEDVDHETAEAKNDEKNADAEQLRAQLLEAQDRVADLER